MSLAKVIGRFLPHMRLNQVQCRSDFLKSFDFPFLSGRVFHVNVVGVKGPHLLSPGSNPGRVGPEASGETIYNYL